MGKYIPIITFLLFIFGITAITYGAFLVHNSVGWVVLGFGCFAAEYRIDSLPQTPND